MSSILTYSELKPRQRELREHFPISLTLRTHRSLSWLERSEQAENDLDARFIFLWIAFNAAYAHQITDFENFSERKTQFRFLKGLITSDQDNLLYDLIWNEFSGPIHQMINNRYVYGTFWKYQNDIIEEQQWLESFARTKQVFSKALAERKTSKLLSIIFDRLYMLRNQLMHGGATWNGSVNREQVSDGALILGKIVPTIIFLMMEHPNHAWGEPIYPVID